MKLHFENFNTHLSNKLRHVLVVPVRQVGKEFTARNAVQIVYRREMSYVVMEVVYPVLMRLVTNAFVNKGGKQMASV